MATIKIRHWALAPFLPMLFLTSSGCSQQPVAKEPEPSPERQAAQVQQQPGLSEEAKAQALREIEERQNRKPPSQ